MPANNLGEGGLSVDVFRIILVLSVGGTVTAGIMEGLSFNLLWVLPLGFIGSFAVFSVTYILIMGIIALFVDKKREYSSVSVFYKAALDASYEFIMRISGVKLHVKGLEKLPDEEFLLVQNHVSNYDNMLTGAAMKHRRLAFVSKPENFKIPIVGRIITRNLYVAIDRDNARNAVKSINRAAELICTGLTSVGIYPEGTRSKSGALGEFKQGSFKVALKARCPLVITSICGTEKIKKNIFLRKTDVYLTVLAVIMPDELMLKRTSELAEIAHGAIEKALA